MQKIIYPYVRFSSDQQSGGSSYKRQMSDILKYAKENGFTVNDSLKLKDLGLSAYTAKHIEKGSLGEFLELLDTGVIENDGSAYLCIEQIDRLSRQSIDDAYQIFRKILKANVNVITLMDKKIYTKDSLNDLMSIMYSSMLMGQANEESAKKSERILKNFDKKIDDLNDGKKIQFVGMIPSWLDNKGTRKETNFVINEKAKIVKRIFDMYISGDSMNGIAQKFNIEKVTHLTNCNYKNRVNTWSSGNINHILKNQCVIGELHIKRTNQIYKNYYPPIISIDDWDAAQALKRERKEKKASGRKSINIFTGKIFCSGCGQKYYFETDDKTTKTGKKLYHSLKCSGRRRIGCKSKTIRYADFIEATIDLFGLLKTEKPKNNTKAIKEIKEKISILNIDSKKHAENIITLEEMNENGELDYKTYLREVSKAQTKIDENQKRIIDFKLNISRLSNTNKLTSFDKNDLVSVEKSRKYIDEIIAAIIVSPDSKSFIALFKNGDSHHFKLKKEADLILGLENFVYLSRDIEKAYKSGTMDGRFIEIIKASSFYDIDLPEKIDLE